MFSRESWLCEAELREEVVEEGGAAEEREKEAVDSAPEVGGVANVVGAATGHVNAVEQVKRREDVTGDRNRDHEEVDAHLRREQNGRKKDGGDGAGGS